MWAGREGFDAHARSAHAAAIEAASRSRSTSETAYPTEPAYTDKRTPTYHEGAEDGRNPEIKLLASGETRRVVPTARSYAAEEFRTRVSG